MYVQGVSTRRVKRIVEELCGTDVSSTQVSRAAAELDTLLDAWRIRDLDCYRYIILDAQYEKVRQGGQVLDAAVLIACGVDDTGNRDILGCSVAFSEAEVHWRTFLSDLKDRRLTRPRTCRQRQPRGPEGGQKGRVPERAVATLPVPPAAERRTVCAEDGDALAGGCRYPCDLQRPGSG